MNNSLDMVQEFHDETGIVTPTRPCVPDWSQSNADWMRQASIDLYNISRYLREAGKLRGAPRCLQRIALETEELGEKASAMASNDLIGVLDAQADQQYVLDGTALECGLGLLVDKAFELVHASNMSKRFSDGTFHRDDAGKILKGPDYVPVNLLPLIKP